MSSTLALPRNNSLHNILPRQTRSGFSSSGMMLPSARPRGVSLDAGSVSSQQGILFRFYLLSGALLGLSSCIRSRAHWPRPVRALTRYTQLPNGFHRILRQLALAWNTATYHLFQPEFADIDLHIKFPGAWNGRGPSPPDFLGNRDRNGHT